MSDETTDLLLALILGGHKGVGCEWKGKVGEAGVLQDDLLDLDVAIFQEGTCFLFQYPCCLRYIESKNHKAFESASDISHCISKSLPR
jgi:hypothetical protein